MSTFASTLSSTSLALTKASSKARVETRRTILPYYLSSEDNPGTLISKSLLHGPNYDEWANNLRLALKARKKFGFADGSIPQPDEVSSDFEDWIANNALVVSWIKLTIDESLSSSLSHTDDSHELWTHIQKRFGVKNGQRVNALRLNLQHVAKKDLPLKPTMASLLNCGEVSLTINKQRRWRKFTRNMRKTNYTKFSWDLTIRCTERLNLHFFPDYLYPLSKKPTTL